MRAPLGDRAIVARQPCEPHRTGGASARSRPAAAPIRLPNRPGRAGTARQALRSSWLAASLRVIGTPASFGRRSFVTRRRVTSSSPRPGASRLPRNLGAGRSDLRWSCGPPPGHPGRPRSRDRAGSREPPAISRRADPTRRPTACRGCGWLRTWVPRSANRSGRRARVGFPVGRVSKPCGAGRSRLFGLARRGERGARPMGH